MFFISEVFVFIYPCKNGANAKLQVSHTFFRCGTPVHHDAYDW